MHYLGLSSQPSIGLSSRRLSWCLTVPSVKSPFAVSTPVAACVKACDPLIPVMTGLASAAPSGTVVLLDVNNDIYASTGSFTLHGRAAAQIGALCVPKAAPLLLPNTPLNCSLLCSAACSAIMKRQQRGLVSDSLISSLTSFASSYSCLHNCDLPNGAACAAKLSV
jgi:hypothetical protein